MLVLGRHEGESIIVNNNIEIMICKIRGNKVRVGVQAPRNIPVFRKELLDKEIENGQVLD